MSVSTNLDNAYMLTNTSEPTNAKRSNLSKIIYVLLVSWVKQSAVPSSQKQHQAQKDGYIYFTWTYVVPYGSKDETLDVLINFLRRIQRGLQAQNNFVKRRNRTLVVSARTMLSVAKLPLFFWAEAIATACFTQNHSLIVPRHEMTPYHIITKRKPNLKILHIFDCTCYIVRDGENLDKMKEKGDACIFVGYSTQFKGFSVYNERARMTVETIHVNFNELKELTFDPNSSSLAPQSLITTSEHNSLGPTHQCQSTFKQKRHEPSSSTHVQDTLPSATKNNQSMSELELLFSPMFYEISMGRMKFIPDPTTLTSQAHAEEDNNTLIDVARHQLEQVCGNPSKPIQIRQKLATDLEMCMFTLTEELHRFDRLEDEDNTVIRNKELLMAMGYHREDGIDFEESFVPIA
ncbi:retrovirus-related pol polyprotein from transposon TNT 1-94 [Tanacetum coccineum]